MRDGCVVTGLLPNKQYDEFAIIYRIRSKNSSFQFFVRHNEPVFPYSNADECLAL